MLAPDTHLKDRYRILHQIGRGGFGTVYKAVDNVFGCSVAIKETKEEVAGHEKLQKAFEREAKLLRNLKHECLPRVTDYFLKDNAQYLVMDFIEGEDLASLLKRRIANGGPPFNFSELLPWAERILSALDYLHSLPEPIIHRDIKPANIKLGNDGEIYLLDFGLAKGAAGQMSTVQDGQSSFSIAGFTHEYAPLEQLQESGTRPQSDIYAFGATLYHLLTGQIPIAASKRDEMVQRGLGDPLRLAHEVNSAVPLPISQAISSAMIVRWWDRLTSAKEMRAALSEALATSLITQSKPVGEIAPSGISQTDRVSFDHDTSGQPAKGSVTTERSQALVKAQAFSKRRVITLLSLAVLVSSIIGTFILNPHWIGIGNSSTPTNTTHLETSADAVSKTPTDLRPRHVADHPGVWSVALSPDGNSAATASKDNTVILWDTSTWKEKVPGHLLGQIVTFSPDGNLLATGGADKRIRLWDARTGKGIDKNPPFEIKKPVYRIALSADGALLASFSALPNNGDTDIQVWDLRSNFAQTLGGDKHMALTAIAFWPRQNILFSAAHDHKLRSWKIGESAKSQVLAEYPDALLTVLAFSPDGNFLACASDDRTIKLLSYQPQSQRWIEHAVIDEDNTEVTDLAFSPDNQTLIATGTDSIVRMWNVNSLGTKPIVLDQSKVIHGSPAFSKNPKTMLTVGSDVVWRWQ